jgi:glucose/arabinose dehydrogenase
MTLGYKDRASILLALASALVTFMSERRAQAQDLGDFRVFQRGFTRPIFMASPPGEPERVFVADIGGQIYAIENGVRLPTPFLDISARLTQNMGLIGVAFPPDYATSRRFYVNYTPNDSDQPRVCRYTTSANPNIANTDEEIILETGHGGGDHNSGWMEFGLDGYLYIARGDAGGNPQDPEVLQGKILRIDVSPMKGYAVPPDNPFVGKPGRDEIAAMGFRNPWRNGIDRLTGDFYFADVGNIFMEEVDYARADDLLGRNFGWPCVEGTVCPGEIPGCTCDSPPMTPPVHAYTRVGQPAWVVGGTVYRGSAIPRWRGRFFFLDGGLTRIYSMRVIDGVATDIRDHTDELNNGLHSPDHPMLIPIAFGSDANGEMYVLEYWGRIVQIAAGYAPADWNLDQTINSADFFDFLVSFFSLDADCTGDHQTTSQDFFEFVATFLNR